MGTESKLPERARVVIIGGGIVGTSVAYHLTRMGWTDVVLLEQGQLSSGTTWHAAGLLGQLRATEGGTRLVQYSAQLYSELERETGLATGFKRCGGVTVARTEERMVQLRRTAATITSPAAVKRTPRGKRSNSGVPRLSSVSLILRFSAVKATCSCSAALRMEPARATVSR